MNEVKQRCIHLGPIQEHRRVRTLLSAIQLPVLTCARHGRCTELVRVVGVDGCCAPADAPPCPDYQGDTYRLVAPLGTADMLRKAEGRCAKKPWEYQVTVAIPHLNTPDLVEAVVELHRLQTVRPYICVIDTGSPAAVCERLEAMRSEDLEIHFVRCNGYRHSSAPVTTAMDVAFATCHTQYMYCTHADVFPMRRELLEWMISLCDKERPAVGWEMSPRNGIDYWRGTLSHTSTILHMPTMWYIGASWSMDRWYSANPNAPPAHNGWPDTETSMEACFKEWSIKKTILGEETNWERQTTEWWDHARSITSLRLYASQSELCKSAELYTGDALTEAIDRAKRWRELANSQSKVQAMRLP